MQRGLRHEIYDTVVQYQIQREFASAAIRKEALAYLHPPFEALMFAPLAHLSYVGAFITWDLINFGALLPVSFVLSEQVLKFKTCSWSTWLLVSLAFFPIFLTLLQGQDSILLLLLYTLVFLCLKKKREKLAGAFLALGLFRPQLVLPFLLLWIARGGRKLLLGFLPIAAVLGLISLAVVGVHTALSYPSIVLHVDRSLTQSTVWPSDMPNLRGMLYGFTRHHPQSDWVTYLLSIVLLVLVAWLIRGNREEQDLFYWDFSLAILTSAAVSHYCFGHDLSTLLLPIALVISKLQLSNDVRPSARVLMLCAVALLFFSPLQLFLVGHYQLGVMGWDVLLLVAGILLQIWPKPQLRNSALAASTLV